MWPRRSVVPLLLVALSLLLSFLSGGCQNKTEPNGEGIPPVGEVDVAAVRELYTRINASNRVGVVVAVHESSNHAAVGDIPLQDFGIGDVLVFLDGREQPFNSGTIVNATSSALHVRYDPQRRAPRVGELAVRLAQ